MGEVQNSLVMNWLVVLGCGHRLTRNTPLRLHNWVTCPVCQGQCQVFSVAEIQEASKP